MTHREEPLGGENSLKYQFPEKLVSTTKTSTLFRPPPLSGSDGMISLLLFSAAYTTD